MTPPEVDERCTCDLPRPPYGHLVCALHGIDPRELPYEITLDDLERGGH